MHLLKPPLKRHKNTRKSKEIVDEKSSTTILKVIASTASF